MQANGPLLLSLMISIVILYMMVDSFRHSYDNARQDAIRQANELIQRVVLDISQSFSSYDGILKNIIDFLEDPAVAELPLESRQRLLSRSSEGMPYVQSILILDVSGNVKLGSEAKAPPRENFYAADFFQEQVNGARIGAYLGFVVRNRFDKLEYEIAISRRMTRDGQFLGVAVVFVRLSDFRDQFTNIDIGRGNMMSLVREGGRILTRKPSQDGRGDFGIEIPGSETARLQEATYGTFVGSSPVDGEERLFVFEKVPDWPLNLIFGMPVEQVFKDWRHRLFLAGGLAGLTCAGFLFFGYRLRREHIRRAQAEAALEQLSHTDFLTGLGNRRRFDELFQREFRRAQRTSGSLSVAILDADHFKALNDRHGHSAGDDALKLIAQAITENVHRPGDFAARLGGEEFAVILPDTPASAAFEVVEKIRLCMEATTVGGEGPPTTTLSAGISSTHDVPRCDTPQALLDAADRALYRAKHTGRNRTELSMTA